LLRLFAGLVEICFAILFPYNLGVAVGSRGGNLFIDTDGADGFLSGRMREIRAMKTSRRPSRGAFEVGVGDDAVQDRNAEQIGAMTT